MPRVGFRRSLSASDGLLVVLALASAYAFFRAQGWSPLGLSFGVFIVSSLSDVGERAQRTIELVAWVLVAAVCVLGIGWTLYFLLDEGQFVGLRGWMGTGLLVLMVVFLIGGRVWRPERGLVPVCLATLVLAAIGPGTRVTSVVTFAALVLVSWLMLNRSSGADQSRPARWGAALGFVSMVAVLAGGIIGALPVAQPLVERAARGFLSGRGNAGLSDSGALGAVEQIGLSRKIVLRMWSDAPSLLRTRVHSSFDGKTWTSPPGGTRLLDPTEANVPGGAAEGLDELPGTTFGTGREVSGQTRSSRILMAGSSRGWIVTPRNPQTVRLAGGTPTIDEAGVLSAPFRPPPSMYGITHGAPNPVPLNAEIRAAALQLPDEIDTRLVDLASRLSGASESDQGRLDATVAWIADCCRYSLDVGAFATDQPVAEFLFDKQRGYCEYFASAAAVLLRLQGIPTRYVTGLSVQPSNRRGDHYLVRALDAHAWIEVWIDGLGWIEVDPTPPGQYAALRAGLEDGWFRRAWEAVSGFTAEVMARVRTDWRAGLAWLASTVAVALVGFVGRWKAGLVVLLLLVCGYAGWRLAPRWRTRGRPTPRPVPDLSVRPDLAALMGRLERMWAEGGHPRPGHRAHLEHLDRLPDDAWPSDLRADSRAAVACYYEARFGGQSPMAEEVARLALALEPSRRPTADPVVAGSSGST